LHLHEYIYYLFCSDIRDIFYLFIYFYFSENSYVNTGLLYNTHSWLPMHIRIELLQNGEVKIKKILPADMESPDEVSIKEDYYKF